MSQKYCLKWNKFQENLYSSLGGLRESREFADVTLACEDGQQVEAHKVILAASSPFFKNMLRKNKHSNPLIYMRGIKTDELVAILDFLYYGEANVFEENLDNFLALAEELKLKGLSGSSPLDPKPKESKKEDLFSAETMVPTNYQGVSLAQEEAAVEEGSQGVVALPSYTFTGEMQELDAKIKSMMAPSENMIQNGKSGQTRAHVCTVCGKEGLGRNIKDHIEANHIDGVSIPCNFCEKTFRSRNNLRLHNRIHTVA